MLAIATHVMLVSLWLWSYGLALTSVGLQGPCWDVKGPRRLLSPPPSVEQSISGRGYLPSMICFKKIRRPFQHSGSLLTCSSPPIPMNYAQVISWRAHTKGSPIEIWIQTMEFIGSTRTTVQFRALTTGKWGTEYIQWKPLIIKQIQVCSRKTKMYEGWKPQKLEKIQ